MKTLSVKRISIFSLFSLCSITLFSQKNPRLIVRSDDMGAFHAVNVATIDAYKNGIQTVVEVMPVTAWFPEAVRRLNENPGIDVGIHLAITSEWENIKWRPLTHCPSLTDENGYFYPMMSPHKAYPGQSILENKWDIDEIEQEFRAQIELTLKNIPQASHLSGHMGALNFDPKVLALSHKLALEYNLTFLEGDGLRQKYDVIPVRYDGSNETDQKEASFISMLNKLEGGKNYIFVDHPALDNDEMKTVGHIGYEWVAEDRQGVTDLLTSEKVKQMIKEKGIELITYNELTKALPRSTPEAEKVSANRIQNYLDAVKKSGQDLHSIMILRHGNGVQLLPESWIDEATASHIASLPAGVKKEDLKIKPKESDWLQGYGYQMWRCRNNGYRADGANGQFIVVLPEKDAVIVTTANIGDMQAELNLIWKYLLPAMK